MAARPLIITEEVGNHDIRVGTALQPESEAGNVISRALALAGLSPDQFSIASLVACKPPSHLSGQSYEFTAPEHCSTQHLRPFIEALRPSCIVALGSLVTRALTGFSGEKQTIDLIRGYVLPGIGVASGIPVIPAPSPSYIASGMHHEMTLLVHDLTKASGLVGMPEDPEADQYELHVYGTREQAIREGGNSSGSLQTMLHMLRGDPNRILAYDFEFIPANPTAKRGVISTEAHITQVNFTMWDPQAGNLTMVSDWNENTKETAIAILQTENIKVGFNNWHIDDRIAEYNGFNILGREIHDAIWLVHFLYPDLPARRVVDSEEMLEGDDGGIMPLQMAASLFNFPAPWKHLNGKDPHFYGARDSHATMTVFRGGLAALGAKGNYGTYDFFVRQYRTELKQAEDRGYPMSLAALGDLQDFIKAEIQALNAKCQDLVPADLKPFKERKPRTEAEIETLQAQYGTDFFKRQVYSEDSCECGKATLGDPSPGCIECSGTGEVAGKKVKCKACSKHAIIKPHNNEMRWSCEWCGWIDNRTAYEMFALWENGKPKNLKSFYKTLHDDDLRSGRYVCKECDGEGTQASSKPCVCTKRKTYDPMCPKCRGAGTMKGMVDRWCIRSPFNPNSHDQLKRYAQARNHNIPTKGLGRDGITQLARRTGDPVYATVRDIKTLEAIAGATAPLTAAAAILDGSGGDVERIHTHFHFTDAAGAISSRNPDIMTAPPDHKYPGLAALWGKCLASRPTETTRLVNVDFGNLDLECFALEARDEGLLQISHNAEEWLLEIAKFRKTVQGTGAIKAIYRAFIRDTSALTVYRDNRHLFSSAEAVAYLLSKLEYQFPRCVEYRKTVANQAHKQGFLRSRFGYERQFYSVLRRSRDGAGYDHGADYENAVSFAARNHAACVMRIGLAALKEDVGLLGEGAQMITPTENGFIFECTSDGSTGERVTCYTLPPVLVLVRPNGSLYQVTVGLAALGE